MIAEILMLGIFIVFSILGIHSVTRPGMLLSFLGQQVSQEQTLIDAESQLYIDLLEAQEKFIEDVNEIDSAENSNKKFDIIELALRYRDACEYRNDLHEEEIIETEIQYEKSLNKPIRKILRPLSKPLTECTTCMSSVWSVIITGAYFLTPLACIVFIPLFVAGFVTSIEKFITKN